MCVWGGGGLRVCVYARARVCVVSVCVCVVSVCVVSPHTHTRARARVRTHTLTHRQRINTPLSMSFALGVVGNVTESCFLKLCLRASDCCRRLACNLRSIQMIGFGCFHRFKPVKGVTREFVSLIRTRIAQLRAGFLPFYSLSSLSLSHTHGSAYSHTSARRHTQNTCAH